MRVTRRYGRVVILFVSGAKAAQTWCVQCNTLFDVWTMLLAIMFCPNNIGCHWKRD